MGQAFIKPVHHQKSMSPPQRRRALSGEATRARSDAGVDRTCSSGRSSHDLRSAQNNLVGAFQQFQCNAANHARFFSMRNRQKIAVSPCSCRQSLPRDLPASVTNFFGHGTKWAAAMPSAPLSQLHAPGAGKPTCAAAKFISHVQPNPELQSLKIESMISECLPRPYRRDFVRATAPHPASRRNVQVGHRSAQTLHM